MAEILTIGDARLAVGLIDTDNSEDADLQATYIPAVAPIVEDLVGPVMQTSGRVLTVDGGGAAIVLPSSVTAIDSLSEDGTDLIQGSGFTVNKLAGIIYRGTAVDGVSTFAGGAQNVVVTYTAGAYTDPADVPANIRLCARIVLAHLWQNDKGGYRPAFGSPDDDVVITPSGFAVPRRAVEAVSGQLLSLGFA